MRKHRDVHREDDHDGQFDHCCREGDHDPRTDHHRVANHSSAYDGSSDDGTTSCDCTADNSRADGRLLPKLRCGSSGWCHPDLPGPAGLQLEP
jgi:hypothetical protein